MKFLARYETGISLGIIYFAALAILAAMLSGCGAAVYPPCQPAPTIPVPGQPCPPADDGKGQCTADHSGILLCNGTWSLATCPEGVRCVDTGTGVGCM